MKYSLRTKEEIQKAIAIWPPYCKFWSNGLCSFPNEWRKDNRSNKPNCKIIPGNENKICNLCKLDDNFINKELT